jgi:hypothetical protein
MVKAREIVIETMDDDRCGLNFPSVVSIGGRSTDGERETKREETDAGHEGEDDAEEADLLSPGPLLLGCADTTSSE